MDGLVSTGNEFPYTILEIIFINQKIFPKYFINILIVAVDKRSISSNRLTMFIDDDDRSL